MYFLWGTLEDGSLKIFVSKRSSSTVDSVVENHQKRVSLASGSHPCSDFIINCIYALFRYSSIVIFYRIKVFG